MRLAVVFGIFVLLSRSSLCNGAQEIRDLPALKMGGTDLDAILVKTHSLIDASNGPEAAEGSSRETVKVRIEGQDIEIPHLSLASSVAFPKEVFGFSYIYNQTDKPISSVTIDLGDSLRRVLVSGGSASKVDELSKLLENDFRRYSTVAGGLRFRRIAGICLSMLFLSSLLISGAYCWNNRSCRMAMGMPICSLLGLLLVLLVPWNRFLPGFVVYQWYSPFLLVRHAPEVSVLALVAAVAGIPVSYFLSRKEQ
jgi:hypothetical protein